MCQTKIDKDHFRAKLAKLREHPDPNVSSFAENSEVLLQELIDAETKLSPLEIKNEN